MDKFNEILNTLINLIGEMSPYILLGFLIAGVMHAFIPSRLFSRHLSGNGLGTVVKSALVGVPLPLCSCGVLPAAISLRRSGASKAATTSFLVATPQTGVDSIAATWSLLGPAFAFVRPIAAFITSIFAGVAVGKNEERHEKEPSTGCDPLETEGAASRPFIAKSIDALRYGFSDLVDSIGSWLVIGLVIAALITVFVPADFFATLSEYPLLAMIAVVIVAVPMYVCATGSIPIALSLMLKGLSPGTALVLLMAGPAANFASFTLISRELGRKAALIYISAIVVCSIGFGLLIDYCLPGHLFSPMGMADMHCHVEHLSWIEITSSVLLIGLLLMSFIRRTILVKLKQKNMEATEEKCFNYVITGMNCSHCQSSVEKALSKVAGVTNVSISLSSGLAKVYGEHNQTEAIHEVESAGFGINPA